MIPIASLSKFLRKPSSCLKADQPYHILISHNTPQAALIKMELFEKLSKTEVWNEICEEWWEMQDEETLTTVKEGKEIMQKKKYDGLTVFS